MKNSRQSAQMPVFLPWAAMLAGLGLLLAELLTGYLHKFVPQIVVWGASLLLLLISVWGMKTLLERRSFVQTRPTGFGNGVSLSTGSKQQAHNLFRLPIEGQIYIAMLAIMLLGALFGKTNTLMLIFAFMAGPFIVNGGVTFAMTRKLFLSRKLPKRLMVGEPTSIEMTLTNKKRLIKRDIFYSS